MVRENMIYRELGRTGLKVSAIGFGTAEIGFAYGMGPRGLPTDAEANFILKFAVDLGINYFDTARAYDLAEERIGRSGIARIDGVVVGTKCAQFLEKGLKLSYPEMKRQIIEEVETSLINLRLDTLPLLYLHGGTRHDIETGILSEILRGLKGAGKVKHTGISLRGEDNALAAIESGFFDVIQVAHSILDQRMTAQVLILAKERGVGVVNRSVLLKGALTNLREHLPDELMPLKINAEKAAEIAYGLGLDLPSLAVRFALSSPSISTALGGTNKVDNLVRSLKALAQGPLPGDVLSELGRLAINDPGQVDPKEWPASAGGHSSISNKK